MCASRAKLSLGGHVALKAGKNACGLQDGARAVGFLRSSPSSDVAMRIPVRRVLDRDELWRLPGTSRPPAPTVRFKPPTASC